jgi:hypothetical protein
MEKLGESIEIFEIIKYAGIFICFILVRLYAKYSYLALFENCDIISNLLNIKNIYLDFIFSFIYICVGMAFYVPIVLLFIGEFDYDDFLWAMNFLIAANCYLFLYSFYWMLKFFRSGKLPKSYIGFPSDEALKSIRLRYTRIKGEDINF